jgi:hypothetical protein
MSRCPFPNCSLEHEDGEHHVGRPARPRGALRLTQGFSRTSATPRCDLESHPGKHLWASAMYADELGYGWALCNSCYLESKGANDGETQTAQADQNAGTSGARRSSNQKSRVSRVVPFAARERGVR